MSSTSSNNDDDRGGVIITSLGSLIIDDVVLPTRVIPALLGGASTHALTGARVWCDEGVAYGGRVGYDFPPRMMQYMQQCGIDMSAVQVVPDHATVRAWSLFEDVAKDKRRFVMRTNEDVYKQHFRIKAPDVQHLSHSIRQAKGVHLCLGTDRLVGMVKEIRRWFPRLEHILWEPSPATLENRSVDDLHQALKDTMPLVDTFSPSLDELLPYFRRKPNDEQPMTPAQICTELLDMGAKVVALRMGAAGSMVAEGEEAQLYTIPAVQVANVVDVTGAGNAYCGGFLASVIRDPHQWLVAGLRASVSASFTIESWGVQRLIVDSSSSSSSGSGHSSSSSSSSWERRIQLEAKDRLHNLMMKLQQQEQRHEHDDDDDDDGGDRHNEREGTHQPPPPSPSLSPLQQQPNGLSIRVRYSDSAVLSNAIGLQDSIPVGSMAAPTPPVGSCMCVSVGVEMLDGVTKLNIGRLAGKVKLVMSVLVKQASVFDALGFIDHTTHIHQTVNAQGVYVSVLILNMYFSQSPSQYIIRVLLSALSSNITIDTHAFNTLDTNGTTANSSSSSRFNGEIALNTGLSVRGVLDELLAAGVVTSDDFSWPHAVDEALVFMRRTCTGVTSIDIHTVTRSLCCSFTGIAFAQLVPALKHAASSPRPSPPSTTTTSSYVRELLRRHPGLLPLAEFVTTHIGVSVWMVVQTLLANQRRVLYHPGTAINAPVPSDYGLAYDTCFIHCADHVELKGWLIRAAPRDGSVRSQTDALAAAARPTFVTFHGNAGTVSDRLDMVCGLYHELNASINILMVEYRGYGMNSECKYGVTERGLILDGLAALDFVSHRSDIGNEIILHGSSLGGAVAVAVARTYMAEQQRLQNGDDDDYLDGTDVLRPLHIRGLVVENTFTSVPDMVGPLFSATVNSYVQDRWPTLERIRTCTMPALFLSSRSDELVPPYMMDALYAACGSEEKLIVHLQGADHNNSPHHPKYYKHIHDFIIKNTQVK